MRQAGANLNVISRTLFVVQGLSCAYYFMEIKGIPKFFRVIAIIFTPVFSLLADMFAIIGVADMGFNFRRRKRGT
jgi:uncharacterized protein YybS (DUF2232 family)